MFCGEIDYDTDDQLVAALESNQIDTFLITSGGGIVNSAINMTHTLNEHNVEIIIRSKCLSACAQYLLALGQNVTVEANTAIGFHRNPYASWLVLLHAGVIEDPQDNYWSGSQINAALTFLAYQKYGTDINLALEPSLQQDYGCIAKMLTRKDLEGNEVHKGFRATVKYSWWVPSREVINNYRQSEIKGWWPNNYQDAYASYVTHSISADRIAFSTSDHLMGHEALETFKLGMCDE